MCSGGQCGNLMMDPFTFGHFEQLPLKAFALTALYIQSAWEFYLRYITRLIRDPSIIDTALVYANETPTRHI